MTTYEQILAKTAIIRARSEAATGGEWTIYNQGRDEGLSIDVLHIVSTDEKADWIAQQVNCAGTATFIAHARKDVPALIDAVEKAAKVLNDIEQSLGGSDEAEGCNHADDARSALLSILNSLPQ